MRTNASLHNRYNNCTSALRPNRRASNISTPRHQAGNCTVTWWWPVCICVACRAGRHLCARFALLRAIIHSCARANDSDVDIDAALMRLMRCIAFDARCDGVKRASARVQVQSRYRSHRSRLITIALVRDDNHVDDDDDEDICVSAIAGIHTVRCFVCLCTSA